MLLEDPQLLHSPDGKDTRKVPAVDAPGWIAKGWTTEKPTPSPMAAVRTPAIDLPGDQLHPPTESVVKKKPV